MKEEMPFTKEINTIRLTPRERRALRARVVAYMEYYPLDRAVTGSTHVGIFIVLRRIRLYRIAGTAAALLLVAVPVLAEQSLPGDALYPVKVRFNEGIRSQLLFSPYGKMQWETARVERRVAEARLLSAAGELTQEKEQTLERTIQSHTDAFQEQLAELRESDTTNAAIAEVTLESALEVQSAVLTTEIAHEASGTTQNEGDIQGLAEIVEQAQADITSPTDDSAASAMYDALLPRVGDNASRIQTLLEDPASELMEPHKADVSGRLSKADALASRAKEAHEAGQDDEAAGLLRNALAVTEKLLSFMTDADLRTNVSLNALLPQEVPDEAVASVVERASLLFSEQYVSLAAAIEALGGSRKADALRQLEKLGVVLARMKDKIEEEDFRAAERLVEEVETSVRHLEETSRVQEQSQEQSGEEQIQENSQE